MPIDNKLSFKNYEKQLPVPVVIYADFESIIVNNEHKVCSVAYYVESRVPQIPSGVDLYFGLDAPKVFLERMKDLSKKLTAIIMHESKKMVIESTDNINSTICHICKKSLSEDTVLDHDHISGRYRGQAHNTCNLKYKPKKNNFTSAYNIVIFFHNLRSYDGHFLIQQINANNK